jgi:hypothetical protein
MIWIRIAALCAIAVALASHTAAAADRALVFKSGQTRVMVKGRITRENERVCFSLRGRLGQHVKVRIIPNGTLLTSGHVESPSGKTDGGPGGVVFDDTVHETGVYRICIEQRQESQPGTFRLEVTVTPPSS